MKRTEGTEPHITRYVTAEVSGACYVICLDTAMVAAPGGVPLLGAYVGGVVCGPCDRVTALDAIVELTRCNLDGVVAH